MEKLQRQTLAYIFPFYLIDILLILIWILLRLLPGIPDTVSDFFHPSREYNVPTFFSASQLFIIGVLFFKSSRFQSSAYRSYIECSFSLLFFLMSIDEVFQIHEWLGDLSDVLLPGGKRENSNFPVTGLWIFIIGIPFSIFITASIFRYFTEPYYSRSWRNKFFAGFFIMMLGAIGVEAISNIIIDYPLLQNLEFIVEEFLEMSGATTILWASADIFLDRKTQHASG